MHLSEPDPSLGDESCHVVRNDPNHVEIEAVLHSPGLVVLADIYYPGWKLEVESNGEPATSMSILRTNRMMRGVLLPAGKHRLTYRYQPVTFKIGAAMSAISWIVLLAWVVRFSLPRHREGHR